MLEIISIIKNERQKIFLLFSLVLFLFILSIPSYIKYQKTLKKLETGGVVAIKPLVHSTSTDFLKFDPLTKSSIDTVPQFVLLSFDGSKSVEMWRDTLAFADRLNASSTPIHFTYFVNSIYLLTAENANKYTRPDGVVGNSAIGFSEGPLSTVARIHEINRAVERGHEIGSHAAGHYSGGAWTVGEWRKELMSFSDLFFNFKENNPNVKFKESLNFDSRFIKGFRAPNLSINGNMYKALSLEGYVYDSSEVSLYAEWPFRDSGGIWHVPISTIYFPRMQRSVIGVDYSIWVNQTNAENTLKNGTIEWENALNDIVDGYTRHFEKSYATNRAPMVIDNHFSTWNDGVYWEALKIFAERECGRPNVRCTTFSDLIRYME